MSLYHDQPPERGDEVPEELLKKIKEIEASPYHGDVRPLSKLVKYRIIRDTEAGTSGFLLHFDQAAWVICFLDQDQWKWKIGWGPLEPADRKRLNSPEFGDGSQPLFRGAPYGNEPCDFAAEVAKTVGRQITGLAIGERCFNFCFEGGRELDVTLRHDSGGRLAYRVFWEQW